MICMCGNEIPNTSGNKHRQEQLEKEAGKTYPFMCDRCLMDEFEKVFTENAKKAIKPWK